MHETGTWLGPAVGPGACVDARVAVPADLPGGGVARRLAVGARRRAGSDRRLLLFPDGTLPSSRWRPLLWLDLTVASALLLGLLFGSTLLDFPDVANPTALPGGIADPLMAAIALVAPLTTASAWSVQRSLRRTRDTDAGRALALVAPAGWLMAASWWACAAIVALTRDSAYALPVEAAGMLALAVTAWVAIRRYGLFDARVVVNRALVYGVLTGCVVAVYLGTETSKIASRSSVRVPQLRRARRSLASSKSASTLTVRVGLRRCGAGSAR